MTWLTVTIAVIAAAAVFPAAAAAHGPANPVATNWRVRLTHVPAGVRAVPVDGDGSLWLRVARSRTLTVLGVLGEPMLRFTPAGVYVDASSPTAQSDKILRLAARGWRKVSTGHAYRWHEHRLHVLEPVGGGKFAIPVQLDGTRTAIGGTLRRVRGGRTWPWLLVSVVLLALGLLFRPLRVTAAAGGGAAAALRVAHTLYGRPFTDAWALADAALTSLVALLLLAAVLAARSLHGRAIAALALGIAAVGEAVVMTPVLTHAVALSELSTTPARALVAIAFAAGVVAAVLGFQALSREEAA